MKHTVKAKAQSKAEIMNFAKLCALKLETDQNWVARMLKTIPGMTYAGLEALRDVGEGKYILELLNPRSKGEEAARGWRSEDQARLIASKLAVAVQKDGKWMKEMRFLHQVDDDETAYRVLDLHEWRVRTFEEQVAMAEVKAR